MIDPIASLLARSAIAALLLVAAWHKVRDRGAYRDALSAYDLLPAPAIGFATLAIPAIELALAIGLLTGPGRLVASLCAAKLLALYAAAMAINLARGRHDLDCGCAGPAGGATISSGLVVRNLLLALVAGVGALPVSGRPLSGVDALTLGGGVATLVLLHHATDRLLAVPGRSAYQEARRT